MKKAIILVSILIIAIVIYIRGYQPQNRITEKDQVVIAWQIQSINGRIVESETTTVTVGSDEIFDGMSKVIKGKKIGTTIQTKITPQQKYGKHYDPNKKQTIGTAILKSMGIDPQDNLSILISNTAFTIRGISGDVAIIDSNPSHTRQDSTIIMNIKERKN